MSKATIIRRKALENVRRQDWDSAIKEYARLVELDRSNPNIYNELGDLYLKTGNKAEAGSAFMEAIDAYAQVSLFNNAVAVCKKVMRLLPARVDVQAKLGFIRMKQGLTKEAESYYISYLDRLAEGAAFEPVAVSKIANDIADEMNNSETVLSKLAECLLTLKLEEDAVTVLIALYGFYYENDNEASMEAVAARIEGLGASHQLEAELKKNERDRTAGAAQVAEDSTAPDGDTDVPTPDASSLPTYGEVEIPPSTRESSEPTTEPVPRAATAVEDPADDAAEAPVTAPKDDLPPAASIPDPAEDQAADAPSADPDPPIALTEEPPATATSPPPPQQKASAPAERDKASHIQVSAIIDEFGDNTGEATDDDHRSRYDLGMAYLEMGLYPEAIREYQAAARSTDFQVKSLEMIGLCFLRQDQPTLAIKQLRRGLDLVGKDDTETIGIRYNLGLAYEMAGDADQARSQFEEVYVVDVTFREVAEKIQKYSSS